MAVYCIHCGVKLAEDKKPCPLCGTVPFHPDLEKRDSPSLYPEGKYPSTQVSPVIAMIIVSTVLFLLPMVITLLCDLQINGSVTWCGYVLGALGTVYVMVVLPFWFRKPNPVIFVPCSFGAIGAYVCYINYATGGSWFWSFALPVIGAAALIVTAVVVLLRYVPQGVLYIVGGALVLAGVFMPVMEILMNLTFSFRHGLIWSFYPLAALVLLGAMLIFLAIHRPARETMERKFFL